MNKICIFCGSSVGNTPDYAAAGEKLSRTLVSRGTEIVYGGGKNGLMGVIADTALGLGGRVVGVIPKNLVDREVAHAGLSRLYVTQSMHERKQKMAELSDAFLVLPGGFGTLEELAEVLSWAQIGLHAKPCGFLNVGGYFDHLFAFFDEMVRKGFLRPASRELPIVDSDIEGLLDQLSAHGRTGRQ